VGLFPLREKDQLVPDIYLQIITEVHTQIAYFIALSRKNPAGCGAFISILEALVVYNRPFILSSSSDCSLRKRIENVPRRCQVLPITTGLTITTTQSAGTFFAVA
jgi:hypothetical protein